MTTKATDHYTLIADSGSTKTEWILADDCCNQVFTTITEGINPTILDDKEMQKRLTKASESIKKWTDEHNIHIANLHIFFYGSGVTAAQTERMCRQLELTLMPLALRTYPQAASDMTAAAHALCGGEPSIACILGTGSNSCLYDGHAVVGQTPSLGYIIGDEGGGAHMGKLLINKLYKDPEASTLRTLLENQCHTTLPDIIDNIYRKPMPNAYLATFTRFIHKYLGQYAALEEIVNTSFSMFLERNILPYQRPDLPVHAVGSLPIVFHDQWLGSIRRHGLLPGKTMRTPTPGLVEYHKEHHFSEP